MPTTNNLPSYANLEAFLAFFTNTTLDPKNHFQYTDSNQECNQLYAFLMCYSNPVGAELLPFIQAAMTLLLSHPLVVNDGIKCGKVPLRTLLLQILGRAGRRAQRLGKKTLPITIPLLLPHFTNPKSFLEPIIGQLHTDLSSRLQKLGSTLPRLYQDPLTLNLLIVLDYFYLLNESFSALNYSGAIDFAKFYHDDVEKWINIAEDYAHWRILKNEKNPLNQFAFCDYPWMLNLSMKASLVKATNGLRMRHQLQDAFFRALFDGVQSPHLCLSVRREHILQDALAQLDSQSIHELSKQIRVKFLGEDGVDEGGLRKEFFQLCWDQVFLPEYGLFIEASNGCFWFKPIPGDNDSNDGYRLVGLLLGLAIYNGVLIEPRLPILLFKLLLDWEVSLEDFSEVDQDLVRNLLKLSELDEIESLGLVFALSQNEELIPDGHEVPVTSKNLFRFLEASEEFLLRRKWQNQLAAFKQGFETICAADATWSSSVVYAFRPEELASLAYGASLNSSDALLHSLQQDIKFDGGFSWDSPQIQWLWQILRHEFDFPRQRAFLHFVTGSARLSVGEATAFTVMRVDAGRDQRLPSSHTCFNILLLPEYSNIAVMREKLILALAYNQGFGLL